MPGGFLSLSGFPADRAERSHKISRKASGKEGMRKSLMVVLVLGFSAVAGRAADLRAELELSSAWLAAGEDLVASVTITNDSTRTVLVPRWLVPGARLDADLFEVTRGDEAATYLGRLVKRAAPGAADFVVLLPGESLRGTTELTRHYDLAAGGEYVVVYRIDLLDDLDALSEKVESNAVAVWREGPTSGSLPARGAAPGAVSSLTTVNCSASQAQAVTTAVSDALGYSTGARNYLDDRSWSTVGLRYTTWFGTPNSGRFDTVSGNFAAIRSAFQSAPIVVDCGCSESYFAYVFPGQPYVIYVCNAFWPAPATGTDSKAGTLVHEMSHFFVVAGTDDHAYGQTACRNLAITSPSLAVENADSHEYFAENTPPLEGGGGGGGSAGTFRFPSPCAESTDPTAPFRFPTRPPTARRAPRRTTRASTASSPGPTATAPTRTSSYPSSTTRRPRRTRPSP
jgi:peptidyl-Lys metalloendopeptidase